MPNPEPIATSSAPPVIHALVAKFADHQETYQRGDYNEAEVRGALLFYALFMRWN